MEWLKKMGRAVAAGLRGALLALGGMVVAAMVGLTGSMMVLAGLALALGLIAAGAA